MYLLPNCDHADGNVSSTANLMSMYTIVLRLVVILTDFWNLARVTGRVGRSLLPLVSHLKFLSGRLTLEIFMLRQSRDHDKEL